MAADVQVGEVWARAGSGGCTAKEGGVCWRFLLGDSNGG